MPPVNTRLDIQFLGRNETTFTSRVKERPSAAWITDYPGKGSWGKASSSCLLISLERSYLNKRAFNKSTNHFLTLFLPSVSGVCCGD